MHCCSCFEAALGSVPHDRSRAKSGAETSPNEQPIRKDASNGVAIVLAAVDDDEEEDDDDDDDDDH
eukprot:1830144-Amphidinium_carterae.1